MLKVGLTGGIGSGKSLVAEMFTLLGVPVLHADDTARYLMEEDAQLKSAIGQLFGKEVYENGRLNRPFLASVVFNDRLKLEALNALVHPVTIAFARQWVLSQTAPYILKEAAIFFESGSYRDMDKMIGVYAPVDVRLRRAMTRDKAGEDVIRKRMDRQMNEEEKMKQCDFVLYNDGSQSVIEQVLNLHRQLLVLSG